MKESKEGSKKGQYALKREKWKCVLFCKNVT